MADTNNDRLDAVETAFFRDQLRVVDKTVYEFKYPGNLSRSLIPPILDVAEDANAYTYRMVKRWGRAKFGASLGDDAPRIEFASAEKSRVIHNVTDSYGYDLLEIKRAARIGSTLDADRARGARMQIEDAIDSVLANGDAATDTPGLLNQSTTNFVELYVLADGATGSKTWASKTAKEILKDVQGMATRLVANLKQAGNNSLNRFTLVVPTEQHALLLQPIGSDVNKTLLKFIQENDPRIAEIVAWHRCDGAGAAAGGTGDRICMYAKDSTVLGSLVPMEFSPQSPQPKNLQFIINCLARCGGVVVRYPVAMLYADGS